MGTATYHETETLRFRGERVSIRRGQQTIEARKLEGPSRFAAIYVDDEGLIVRIDLPKLRDEEPQRWIRMLWPSEF